MFSSITKHVNQGTRFQNLSRPRNLGECFAFLFRTAGAVVWGEGGGVVGLRAEPLRVRRQAQDAQRVHQGAATFLFFSLLTRMQTFHPF